MNSMVKLIFENIPTPGFDLIETTCWLILVVALYYTIRIIVKSLSWTMNKTRKWWEDAFYFRKSIITMMINLFIVRSDSCDIRHAFRTQSVPTSQGNAVGHSHPQAAQLRTNADNFITGLIYTVGLTPYSKNRSVRDQNYGISGRRLIFWAKDIIPHADVGIESSRIFKNYIGSSFGVLTIIIKIMLKTFSCICYMFSETLTDLFNFMLNKFERFIRVEAPQPRHIIKMIDDDYYFDRPQDLLDHGYSTILFTFTPRMVSGVTVQSAYTIVDNRVIYKVAGGAMYNHQIWDYNTDVITVRRSFGLDVYAIEQRVVNDGDHSIVGLFYQGTIYGFASYFIPEQPLRRKQFKVGEYNYNTFMQKDTVYHSIGLPGDFSLCGIPDTAFKSCLIRARAVLNEGKLPSLSDIERMLNQSSGQIIGDVVYVASVFWCYLKSNIHKMRLPDCLSQGSLKGDSWESYHYQSIGPLHLDFGAPSMRKIAGPWDFAAEITPAKSHSNDVATVKGRIRDVANPMSWNDASPKLRKIAQDFIKYIVPDDVAGTLAPLNEYETNLRLDKPRQKSKYERWKLFSALSKFKVTSFQKREAYNKITYPRNISTVPEQHKQFLCSYMYSFEHILKSKRWYAFSKTPNELFESIHNHIKQSKFCLSTDFSKFDGHYNEFFHTINTAIMKRAFAPRYHHELVKLLSNEVDYNGVTKFGINYFAGTSTPSGSPRTSAFNSLTNCFITYAAIKYHSYANLKDEVIENMLGFYGGDDGVVSDVHPKMIKKITDMTGLKIELEMIESGPVPFLGRIMIDPWRCPISVCDVKRQLRKFMLTTAESNITDETVLYRKSEAYLITDPTTPIMTLLCRYFLQTKTPQDIPFHDIPWFAQFHEMFPPTQHFHDLAVSCVATNLGISVDELVNLESRLELIVSSKQQQDIEINKILSEIKSLKQVKVDILATYNGELHRPINKSTTKVDNSKPGPSCAIDTKQSGHGNRANGVGDKRSGNNQQRPASTRTDRKGAEARFAKGVKSATPNGGRFRKDQPKTQKLGKIIASSTNGPQSTDTNITTTNDQLPVLSSSNTTENSPNVDRRGGDFSSGTPVKSGARRKQNRKVSKNKTQHNVIVEQKV